jgi:peptide/nickel transport system ATP-binding protein
VSRTAASPLLSVDGLTTRFPTPRGTLHAVDRVSFVVGHGESVGIVGESGSGKSMLCRSVLRLTPAAAVLDGAICFDGVDLMRQRPRALRALRGARLALVLQNPMTSLNPVVRIGRQLTEPLEVHSGLSRPAARQHAVDLLRRVGLPDPARQLRAYPHELSGGMRQRVCIAIAISCRPALLLADEPTTALDVTVQRQILDLLSDLRRQHAMAMVLVSHDIGVVAHRTDRVLVMYGGRIVETGPTRVVFAVPRHPYTAALLASVPRLRQPSHTRLAEIAGRPVEVVDPAPGCRFAPRCTYAQPRCLREDPVLADDGARAAACFFPVGTRVGAQAREANVAAGRTAAGRLLNGQET